MHLQHVCSSIYERLLNERKKKSSDEKHRRAQKLLGRVVGQDAIAADWDRFEEIVAEFASSLTFYYKSSKLLH